MVVWFSAHKTVIKVYVNEFKLTLVYRWIAKFYNILPTVGHHWDLLSSADQLIEKYQTEEFSLINIACINLKSRCLRLYVHINVCGTLKKTTTKTKHVPYLKPEVKPRKRRGGGHLKVA